LLLLDGMHGGILGMHVSVHMRMHNAHATHDCGRQRARMLACLSYAPPVRHALCVTIVSLSLSSYHVGTAAASGPSAVTEQKAFVDICRASLTASAHFPVRGARVAAEIDHHGRQVSRL
jgi:hypothetical protein